MTSDEWDEIKESVIIDYNKDSYFAELKNNELLAGRIEILQNIEPYLNRFFSEEYVMTKVFNMTTDDIKEMRKQIYNEAIRRRTELPIPKNEDNPSSPGFSGSSPPATGGIPGGNPGGNPGVGGSVGGQQQIQNTGLGGVNNIPLPPPEDGDGTEEADKDSSNEDEPELNTNIEFPKLPGQEDDDDNEQEDNEKQ